MASSSDPWVKEYNEASRLADDISSMIADRGSLPQSGPEIMRHTSAIRRKITILGTRLDSLESLLARIPPKSMYVLLLLLLYVTPYLFTQGLKLNKETYDYIISVNLCKL